MRVEAFIAQPPVKAFDISIVHRLAGSNEVQFVGAISHMIYVGWDGRGYRTWLATSTDLVNWVKKGILLDRGPQGSFTQHNIAMTLILRENELYGAGQLRKVDGMYIGTYHAYPSAGYEEGSAVIGLCYSKDLINWKVGDPILRALETAGWEAGGLYKSWLMGHDGVYYLFYNAKTSGGPGGWIEQTGLATSEDLTNWKRHESNPLVTIGERGSFDDIFASDPCVFHHNKFWWMFYFGNSSDGHARESVAYSPDLIHWVKSNEVLVDVGVEDSVDSLHAHKPGMIASPDGRLYHFYTAVSPQDPVDIGGIVLRERRGISFATN
jgi:predicted GH43/DUF377 family glycosyl hydrolase